MSTTAVSFAAAGAMAVCSLLAAAQPTMMSIAHDELIQRFLASDEASPIAYLNGRDLNGERDVCATADAGTPSSLTPALAPGERHGSHVD